MDGESYRGHSHTGEKPEGEKKTGQKIETQTEERAWKPTEIHFCLQHNTAGRREEEYLL